MNKKILNIILIILLIFSIIAFSYIFIKNKITIKELTKIEEEKQKITISNNEINNSKEILEKELTEIKEKQKEKISEYEVWKETNQKIKKIIG